MSSISQSRAGLACIAGAFISIVGGIATTVAMGSTSVSDEVLSHPWEGATFVVLTLSWALSHLLIIPALLWLQRTTPAGAKLALAGTVLLTIGELASIAVRDQQLSDTGASIVGAVFGLATLLFAGGFLIAGVKALKAPEWTGWRRFTPLAVGVVALVMIGLAVTPVWAVGVAALHLCLAAFGLALLPAGEARSQVRPAG